MNKLMCHVVAGYPNFKDCQQLMLGMQQTGVMAIEVQIPFSDPIADGETIMQANDAALNSGMTTAKSFELMAEARQQGLSIDLYVMSYLQKVAYFGFNNFCHEAQRCKAKGLIIPDLPYDSPEFSKLHKLASQHQLDLIPVLSPGMDQQRLQDVLELKPSAVYVTSTQGITGNKYTPAKQLKQLAETIKRLSDCQVMVGFGINNKQDVQEVLSFADTAIVGSAVIKKMDKGILSALKFIESLIGEI